MKYSKAEVRANRLRWLAALESGEYEQTDGHLRHGDRFCCLGVACDVFDDGEWAAVSRSSPVCEYETQGVRVGVFGVVEKPGPCDEGPLGPPLRALGMSDRSRRDCYGWNDNGKPFTFIAARMRDRWRLPKGSR
jgi:hypothetical protein